MFETEYFFEELPVTIGGVEIAMATGTAVLEGEEGPYDYGFSVTGIELEGNLIGDYRDKRTVTINTKSDDPAAVMLFGQLAKRIENDKAASDHFYTELEEHQATAFAA